jgi:hypothetical protein
VEWKAKLVVCAKKPRAPLSSTKTPARKTATLLYVSRVKKQGRKSTETPIKRNVASTSASHYANNADSLKKYVKDWREDLKASFLEMYGGHCELCDPNDPDAWEPEFLSLDHVKGDGAEGRRDGHATYWFYQDAIKDGVPDFTKYRILCHNHNQALGHPRKPHELLSRTGRVSRDLADAVIEGYGAKCACCGETTREFLQLDHVNGGGCQERKSIGTGGVYRLAVELGFPPQFQLLCAKCNMSKHKGGGVCLHQRREMVGLDGSDLGRFDTSIWITAPDS